MSAKLVVLAGPDAGKVFNVAAGPKAIIGRGDTAVVRVTENAVSRAHCVLDCSDGKAILQDSGSRCGTLVNGKPISQQEVREGDVIQLANTKLQFHWVVVPKPQPEPEAEPNDDWDIEELRKLSGTTLAHFKIGAFVGAGNSGVVFRAQDFKEEREVALKVYKPEFARNDEDLQRFIRAVKTMLPMRHQNVVILYGGGKTGPHCWMSMEYVEGENLVKTIARIGKGGKLDWRPALNVARDVGRGLSYIHGENIIHRSLSPAKVLFSRLGKAKLGSLILAKALSGDLAINVTTGGEFLSDVCYLSPEQVSDIGTVDCRSDIYCLGALVYALLTGTPPFQEATTIDTARAVLEKEPKSPRTLDPTIPPGLERIVLQMLAKKQEARFQSANDLLMALSKFRLRDSASAVADCLQAGGIPAQSVSLGGA